MRKTTTLALLAALTALPAAAHVTLDPPQASAASYVRGALRVPHGCAGAATIRVTVTLPEGTLSARPMPKAGWTIRTTRRPLETPISDGHGGQITDAVAEIIWEGGPLPDGYYEEFVLQFRSPERPGETVFLPTVQDCEGGTSAAWTEIPRPGTRITDYRMPAPSLRLLPARTAN